MCGIGLVVLCYWVVMILCLLLCVWMVGVVLILVLLFGGSIVSEGKGGQMWLGVVVVVGISVLGGVVKVDMVGIVSRLMVRGKNRWVICMMVFLILCVDCYVVGLVGVDGQVFQVDVVGVLCGYVVLQCLVQVVEILCQCGYLDCCGVFLCSGQCFCFGQYGGQLWVVCVECIRWDGEGYDFVGGCGVGYWCRCLGRYLCIVGQCQQGGQCQ